MDSLLSKVTGHAMNYAIRSGITITATYAATQCNRLLKEAPRGKEREELLQLQRRLENKISIISPAIDMIELISARGNTTLDSALKMSKEIRYEIQKLGTQLNNAANENHLHHAKIARAKPRPENESELRFIIESMKALLVRIEDAVPLISLAITTSGVSLSTKLSGTVSPSRLLQASTFLTGADTQYIVSSQRQQVDPTYILSVYMLFAGHARHAADQSDIRHTKWKEVIHKARVKLMRVSLDHLYDLPGEQVTSNQRSKHTIRSGAPSTEYAYHLVIIEDLDDDRYHDYEDPKSQPGPFQDVLKAGIKDIVPIHEISKVFYADTGKILNIGGDGDSNSPVLLLKRDVHAEPPRRMLRRSQMDSYLDDTIVSEDQSEIDVTMDHRSYGGQQSQNSSWRFPADLDPEWIAFEVYNEASDSDSEPDEPEPCKSRQKHDSPGSQITNAMDSLKLDSPMSTPSPFLKKKSIPTQVDDLYSSAAQNALNIKTSISLLEMLLKLTALQQFRQESHLAIEDELLNFFLENSATAGAGPDKDFRQRLRHEAIHRVGFDPYDESPVKRRTEQYIQHPRGEASPRPTFDPNAFTAQMEQRKISSFNHDLFDEEADNEPEDHTIPQKSQRDYRLSISPRVGPKITHEIPSSTPALDSTHSDPHSESELNGDQQDHWRDTTIHEVDTPSPSPLNFSLKVMPVLRPAQRGTASRVGMKSSLSKEVNQDDDR